MQEEPHLPSHGFDHLRVSVAEQQRAMAEHVADELVAVQVPLPRSVGACDRERERVDAADIVGYPAGKGSKSPPAELSRTRVLGGPPRRELSEGLAGLDRS